MKICRECKISKDINEFAKSGIKEYPYRGTCKTCCNSESKKSKVLFKRYLKNNGLKQCGKCREIKILDAFYNIKNRKTSTCKTCSDNILKIWRDNNRKRTNEIAKKWRDANKQYVLEFNKNYYRNNKQELIQQSTDWVKNNRGKRNAYCTKRVLAKKHRTPKWLTEQHVEQIEYYYIKASELTKSTGIKYQVDHIIPLNGKTVSGLHVPWNLQILTQEENIRKFNNLIMED